MDPKIELKEKLGRIFDMKTTFDSPGESNEQEAIFIEVENIRGKVKDGLYTGRINGQIFVYGNTTKLPLGYFSKQIDQASSADKSDFWFDPAEQNINGFRNIAQRSLGFVYFFSGQYDPEVGTITSIENDIEVTP